MRAVYICDLQNYTTAVDSAKNSCVLYRALARLETVIFATVDGSLRHTKISAAYLAFSAFFWDIFGERSLEYMVVCDLLIAHRCTGCAYLRWIAYAEQGAVSDTCKRLFPPLPGAVETAHTAYCVSPALDT